LTTFSLRRLLIGLLSMAAVPVGAAAAPLRFEAVFRAAGEPASLHYRATFRSGGGAHRLEVWRDGDRRIKRVTDGAVETYVMHRPGDDNFQMQALDLRKRINTHIDRTTMYRMGNFTDWFDLGHGVRMPKGVYQLTQTAAPAVATKPLADCDWYTLTQGARRTQLCWDPSNRLPLLIVSGGLTIWQITAIDRTAFKPSVFEINDKGFVRVDAVRDTERD